MLERRTQTNEPARCALMLPLLAALPQPLALLEVGASAGLCLLPDRYGYDYDGPAPRRRLADPALHARRATRRCPPRFRRSPGGRASTSTRSTLRDAEQAALAGAADLARARSTGSRRCAARSRSPAAIRRA